ncbi:protein of unknown function [Litoreibacter ascidiaceicola]|uniref:DUF4169 domain-containing protein n=1 Tax=Litoreibacter ascidiaceicola TaxID=1486859 RepID=A0A1M4SNW3_9RHOB|nr:DUF4169 family protein [Litoreibacter ascidiaceicola]SHE33891.1 protein of unknown function [Litoreibacter ascidiaceicola]
MKAGNLSKARKERTRADKRAQGDANALKFGRTKVQKQADMKAQLAARTKLDGHKLDE